MLERFKQWVRVVADPEPRKAVGIVGTFDVENYGDLLFPLLAQAALSGRGREVEVVPFSPNRCAAPAWPYTVHSSDDFNDRLTSLSALLVGGGQIIRFDDSYPVPVPPGTEIPLSYWLIPAISASLVGKPVFWNAVGVWNGSPRVPAFDDTLTATLLASHFVGVRDNGSRKYLERIVPGTPVQLLPDTAFSIARLWPLAEESAAFAAWRKTSGTQGRYVVVQANPTLAKHRATLEAARQAAGNAQVVVLPVCWCHGDRAEKLDLGAGAVRVGWLEPKLLAEILARSELIVASSLHATITGLAYGVPVARASESGDRKFSLLDGFTRVADLEDRAAVLALLAQGRSVDPKAVEAADRLERYWAQVYEVAIEARPQAPAASAVAALSRAVAVPGAAVRLAEKLDRRWNRFLGRPSSPATHPAASTMATMHRLLGRIFQERRVSTMSAADIAAQSSVPTLELADLGGGILALPRIQHAELQHEPFGWGFIDELFSKEDAAELAATFPTDHYKAIEGYDGEKGYVYRARSLIHMGAKAPTFPEYLSPAWRRLASDLLSPAYRAEMSRLSGIDLTDMPLEVNLSHYGTGAYLGPHVDLKEKLVTQVLYFNDSWNPGDGGCVGILRSKNPQDLVAEVPPIVGNSIVLIRSNRSWHQVSRVVSASEKTRRSMTVVFHLKGSVSSMWPPGDASALFDYPVVKGDQPGLNR